MGRLIVNWRYVGWVTEKRLELSHEDYQLREKRMKMRNAETFTLLPWQTAFVKRLEPCPYCGEKPCLNADFYHNRFNYKVECPNDCHLINCGDWYLQLSRAGCDWRYRVREALTGKHKCCRHWQYKGG